MLRRLGVVSSAVVTITVTTVTYLMVRQGKAPGEVAAGIALLTIVLLIPLLAVRRYLIRPSEQRPPLRRFVVKLPIILVAAPLLSSLAFYTLYPSSIAVVAVVGILLAVNWVFFFRD